MERVDVTILGRDYSLACSAEEKPTLVAAVRHVDQLMLRIQGTGKVSSNERIAVMAALNIAHEHLSKKHSTTEIPALSGAESGLDFGAVKRRISDMEAKLEAVLEPQEKLI